MSNMVSQIDVAATHQSLLRDGFVRVGNLLSPEQIKILQEQSATLLEQPSRPWKCYLDFSESGAWQPLLLGGRGRSTNYLDCIGVSDSLDATMDGLFARNDLQDLLRRVLGPHRIWYVQIRRAEPGARSLRMHQDLPGEVGLGILITPVSTPNGTTVFIPRSHRWPRLINAFPFLSPGIIRPFVRAIVGDPGDAYLFYNATWHGMLSASEKPRTALLFTFLPLSADNSHRLPPQSLLEKIGPSLRQAMTGAATVHGSLAEFRGDANAGPDDVVAERLPRIPLLSLWRIPMFFAACSSIAVNSFRRLRRFVRRL